MRTVLVPICRVWCGPGGWREATPGRRRRFPASDSHAVAAAVSSLSRGQPTTHGQIRPTRAGTRADRRGRQCGTRLKSEGGHEEPHARLLRRPRGIATASDIPTVAPTSEPPPLQVQRLPAHLVPCKVRPWRTQRCVARPRRARASPPRRRVGAAAAQAPSRRVAHPSRRWRDPVSPSTEGEEYTWRDGPASSHGRCSTPPQPSVGNPPTSLHLRRCPCCQWRLWPIAPALARAPPGASARRNPYVCTAADDRPTTHTKAPKERAGSRCFQR